MLELLLAFVARGDPLWVGFQLAHQLGSGLGFAFGHEVLYNGLSFSGRATG